MICKAGPPLAAPIKRGRSLRPAKGFTIRPAAANGVPLLFQSGYRVFFFLVVPPTLHWRRSIDEKRLALMQNSNEKGAVPRPRKGSAGRVALLLSLSLPSNGVTEFFFIGSTTLDPGCPKKGLPFMQNVNKKGAVPRSKGFLRGPY